MCVVQSRWWTNNESTISEFYCRVKHVRRVDGILTHRRGLLIESSSPANTCVSAELCASQTCLLLPCHSARHACAHIGAKTVCQRAPCMRARWRKNCVMLSFRHLTRWSHNLICKTPLCNTFWCLGYQSWQPLDLRTLMRCSCARGGPFSAHDLQYILTYCLTSTCTRCRFHRCGRRSCSCWCWWCRCHWYSLTYGTLYLLLFIKDCVSVVFN